MERAGGRRGARRRPDVTKTLLISSSGTDGQRLRALWVEGVLPLSTASVELGSPKIPFFYFFHPFLETVLLSAGSGRV